jgi:hypothetical protein
MENIIKGVGALDFDAIESMDATFIANRYDADHDTGENDGGDLKEITEEIIEEEEAKQEEHSRMSTSGSMNKK